MENQDSSYSKKQVEQDLLLKLTRAVSLGEEDLLKVRSFIIFALNQLDNPIELLHLFPSLYENAHGKGKECIITHPTYHYIIRRLVLT